MKKVLAAVLMGLTLTACNENKQTTNENMEQTTLQLTQEWDKTFPKSDKVDHKKVTFKNRYGIELAADMYTPKNAEGKLPVVPQPAYPRLRQRDRVARTAHPRREGPFALLL